MQSRDVYVRDVIFLINTFPPETSSNENSSFSMILIAFWKFAAVS